MFIFVLDFKFAALTYGEKAYFPRKSEQIDDKSTNNKDEGSVNKEANRFKGRPTLST